MQALPDTEQEVQARLQELHLELEPLREQKRNIDGRVQRCPAQANLAGLVVTYYSSHPITWLSPSLNPFDHLPSCTRLATLAFQAAASKRVCTSC